MPGDELPREIARALLARDETPGGRSNPELAAASLQRSCVRVCAVLRNAMGVDGSDALLGRALARTQAKHPAIASICRDARGTELDGVAAAVDKHGIEAVTVAVEALFEALVDVLARLIGEDMVVRLMDPYGSATPGGDGRPTS